MKKKFADLGGIILFYLVLVIGVLPLNLRVTYLNKLPQNNNYIGIKNWTLKKFFFKLWLVFF